MTRRSCAGGVRNSLELRVAYGLLKPMTMRRLLFALWLVSTAAAFALAGWFFFPHTSVWLLLLAAWAVGLVPLSFREWFKVQHAQEQRDVEAALRAWKERAPTAGARLVLAIDEALAEEDEAALRRLLTVLPTDPPAADFITAAQRWLGDNGGRASREAHLLEARAQLPRLAGLSP